MAGKIVKLAPGRPKFATFNHINPGRRLGRSHYDSVLAGSIATRNASVSGAQADSTMTPLGRCAQTAARVQSTAGSVVAVNNHLPPPLVVVSALPGRGEFRSE